MTGALAFAPVLGWPVLGLLALLGLVPVALAAWRRAPGAAWRLAALLIVLVFLAQPVRVVRTGTMLPDIAVLVVDRSDSMRVGDRASEAAAAARQLVAEADAALQVRRVDVPEAGIDGTALFTAIGAALADIPPEQRAGVIALTDGVVSDAPAAFALPLHVLIPAQGEQTDRSLRILRAPGFGVVGQSVEVGLVVDDLGPTPPGAGVHLSWAIDGAPAGQADVTAGQPTSITVPITRGGPLTLSIEASALPGEASGLNNRAALRINGVRDRLRVLLVSGQPHAGERTWRRLLKADPSVDLVHFTILRPPGKEDMTPLNRLALIAFPVRELFEDKIRQFDLIILDRFSDPGVLPSVYLERIADYVRQGGALLVSAGPEFAGPDSIAAGPIGDVLPARPLDGADAVVTGAFRPQVTALGARHPVTEALPGAGEGGRPGQTASWGQWYRRIAIGAPRGDVVLQAGPGGPPLLVLDRVGDGRVALLLSDQIWLWSRGHQGGGPQAELLRRVAHWLMKEPELDETALTARVADGVLTIERHATTPADPAVKLVVTGPDGLHIDTPLSAGLHETASVAATEPGLWQAQYGAQHAYLAVAAANAAEFADLRATAQFVRPAARSVHWLGRDGTPHLRDLAWRRGQAMRLTGVSRRPLLPPWAALALVLVAIGAGWRREGR